MGTKSTTTQRTLVLVKPDAMQRGLAGEVICRLERKGLRIAAIKLMQVTEELAGQHYEAHREKAFFASLVDFITCCPIIAMVVEGRNAIDVVRQTMGLTDPAKAAPGTIRGDLAMDIQNNLVHGSDSVESARREIALFFQDAEILDYTRGIDNWMGSA
ncbi:MAG: nucleoside-diphosphate kinase [Dehalococcoidia bacterium]|nr:nucleoside-diphosphate kinase [Dehalococcoidia bacterium]